MAKYNTQNYGQIEYESYKGFQMMVQSPNSPKLQVTNIKKSFRNRNTKFTSE